jgi:predicted DCC family thiol-disulfide oxidoreductase YuxK
MINQNTNHVYYDGSCPLCSLEINFYKKFAESDKIVWEDISPTGKGKLHPDLNPKIAMKRFHIFNDETGLLSGAAAFAALWTLLPAFRIYGIIARKKPIIYLLEFFYLMFLVFRPVLQRLLKNTASHHQSKKELEPAIHQKTHKIVVNKIHAERPYNKAQHLLFYL